MTNIVNEIIRVEAKLDPHNSNRYVIAPLLPGKQMDLRTVFRAIKRCNNIRWKEIAEFAGLDRACQAFRVGNLNPRRNEAPQLYNFLVIDAEANQAYFYDHNHQPADVVLPYVGPTLTNGEDATQTVTTRIPVKITTRVVVGDDLDRRLTMTLTTSGGYIIGISNVNLGETEVVYQVSGTAKSLNNLLRKIYFVGMTAGAGSIIVKVVDPNSDNPSSTVSTTVNVTIEQGKVESIPAIQLPESPSITMDAYTEISPITVSDTDGKVLLTRLSPFGCNVFGFKSYLGVLTPGKTREILGTPEDINAELAKLQVIATDNNASIGVELTCGKTRLLEYLQFNVTTAEDDLDDDEAASGSAITPAVEPEAAVSSATLSVDETKTATTITSTPTEPETPVVPTIVAPAGYQGQAGTNLSLAASVTGDDTTKYKVTIVPTNCGISINGSGNLTTAQSKTDTISNLNIWLNKLGVVVGTKAGAIGIVIDSVQKIIPITVLTTEDTTTTQA